MTLTLALPALDHSALVEPVDDATRQAADR